MVLDWVARAFHPSMDNILVYRILLRGIMESPCESKISQGITDFGKVLASLSTSCEALRIMEKSSQVYQLLVRHYELCYG